MYYKLECMYVIGLKGWCMKSWNVCYVWKWLEIEIESMVDWMEIVGFKCVVNSNVFEIGNLVV